METWRGLIEAYRNRLPVSAATPVVTLHEGAAWLQPPRIEHRVLDYSDDCELLEIVVPANFKTVELE